MSEKTHSVQTCSNIEDSGEVKPKDMTFPRGKPSMALDSKNPKNADEWSIRSSHHPIPQGKGLKQHLFPFNNTPEILPRYWSMGRWGKEYVFRWNREKSNILLPKTRVFTFQDINTRSHNTDFFLLYIVLWRRNPLFVTRIFTLFPLHPNKKVFISTISISMENKDVSLLLLAQTNLMRASFFHLNNLVLASTGTRLLN